jgi:hypothetical protein
MSFASDSHVWRPVGSRRQRRRLKSTHIRVKASTAFADEAVDPRRNNGQRHRAKLEHGIVERADVEFETRSFPKLPVATLATLPSMSLIPAAPLKLDRCPRSLGATLAPLPSMSLIPAAPFCRLHFAQSIRTERSVRRG